MPLWMFFGVLALMLPVQFALNIVLLRLIASRLRLSRLRWRRCAAIVGVLMVLGAGSALLDPGTESPVVACASLLAIVTILLVLMRRLGGAGWWRTGAALALFLVAGTLAGLGLTLGLRASLITAYHLTTGSMTPTLVPGDRFLVDRTLTPRRWDVAVFRTPVDERVVFAKRVVGLPGETVEIIDGVVHINGGPMEPPPSIDGLRYSSPPSHRGPLNAGENYPVTLGMDEYFVLGDNAAASEDSRHWPALPGYSRGAVPRGHVIGTARAVYFPWGRMRVVR